MVAYLPLLLIVGVLALWLHRTGRIRSGPALWAGLVFIGALVVNRSVDPVGVLAAVLLAAMMLGRSENPRVRGRADRVFYALFAGFAAMAVIWLIAGILPLLARNVPAVEEAFVRWGGGTDIAEVRTEGRGPGTWPVVGEAIQRTTTAELGSAIGGGESLSGPVIGMQYAFSIMNVALGIFLMVLRPRDTVARLLALGMVGTGAVFNNEAHFARDVIPWIDPIHGFGFHGVAGMTYLAAIVLFPDGRLKPDWHRLSLPRRAARVAYLTFAFVIAASWIMNTHGRDPVEYIAVFGLLIPVFGLASQVGKFRHADNDVDRRQSRLLATTLVAALAGAVTFGVLAVALSVPGTGVGGLQTFIMNAFPALFGAIPVILFVILIRFRLWDIDRVINRGFVYGGLAGFIGVAYVSIVVLGSEFVTQGRSDLWLSVLATGIVAVGFQPLRDRLGALANRLVYGHRETPYEVLARFSGRVAETYAGDDVLPRMARMVAEGTSAARSEVWVVVGGQLVRAAAWPRSDDGADGPPGRVAMTGDELPTIPGADLAVAVSLQGGLLGALTVTAQRDEQLTPEGGRLLHDLASQAGLVLRNIHLTEQLRERLRVLSRRAEELRDSRQRIVSTQDAERRRMERDIHDGAQQHLVALAVKLRLARTVAERDPERARPMLDELREEVDEALETLRNLARGIYPAVLADRGLVAAIRSAAERSPLDVRVVDRGIDRYTQEIETAVYFCVLEALQNAAKYASASQVTVELSADTDTLTFEVRDDGVGFEPATQQRGRGLQNLEDRLASLDGAVTIGSRPAAGTTVVGRVPLLVLEPVG
ncbi:MAG: sensor histidine kinase [Actinobacteria bacterium]|nr:sensor histidine kinase [Actinomycetota bacterium]